MQITTALFAQLRSRISKKVHLLETGPLGWWIILLFIIIFYSFELSLTKPGMAMAQLAPFGICTIVPNLLGAYFKKYRGAIISWFLLQPGVILIPYYGHGATWDISSEIGATSSMMIATLCISLATGHFRTIHYRLNLMYLQLKEAHATIQKQALTDGLTGLPNHRAIVDQLQNELERARRYKRPFSVLFFDADRFKQVNDAHGHTAGDTVLCQIGKRANSVLRGGDTLGRFGGEEFVILLPEADGIEAATVAERVRAAVAAEPIAVSGVERGLPVTVSIGLATYPNDGLQEQELLSQADEAMYIAKRLGRNQVRTAEEARRMSADLELMALLQQEGQREAAERAGTTPEHLRDTYTLRTINSLMALLERRDEGLSAHAYAVSDLATAIAQEMGQESKDVTRIGMAALMHDIGKVAIPDMLLQKTVHLSTHERALLEEHAELGAQILEASPFLHDLNPAVHHHHEHWDGSGYPNQLSGYDIPLASRIIGAAEAYDSMLRDHPYQVRLSQEDAMAELRRCADTQFDPKVIQALLTVLEREYEQQNLQKFALRA